MIQQHRLAQVPVRVMVIQIQLIQMTTVAVKVWHRKRNADERKSRRLEEHYDSNQLIKPHHNYQYHRQHKEIP